MLDRDAKVPLMDCPLWMKRNKMKERLMFFVFFALDVAIMKTGKKLCDHFLVNSHHVCWAGRNHILFSCWSSTESSPGMYTAAPLGMFIKLPPFFSSPFKCLRLSEIIIFLQWGYRHIGMVSIAQTCPLHNCSHLGKVVVKPSTVLESQGLLHNSTPKFGLSFTG